MCPDLLQQAHGTTFQCVKMISRHEISIARPPESHASVSAMPLVTPALNKANRSGGADSRRSGTTTSNGKTTVGTGSSASASSLADSAPGTAHSPASSSDEEMSLASTPPAKVARGRARARTPGTARKSKLVSSATAAPAARASAAGHQQLQKAAPEGGYRVAGPSNVRAHGAAVEARRGQKSTAATAETYPLTVEHWAGLKGNYGWKSIYWKASDNIDVHAVPLRCQVPKEQLVEVRKLTFSCVPSLIALTGLYSYLIDCRT
jgi:hypothetical protein